MDVKTPLTASVGTLAKAPVRNFQNYASLHPDNIEYYKMRSRQTRKQNTQ